MNLEPVSDQSEIEVPPVSLPFPLVWWGRVLYGLFVTVLPVFSFWATDLLKPEWQAGKLQDYLILLLFPEASLLFFPLLTYSIVCYLLLLIEPTRFSGSFIVRAGIYTGVLLSLHYSVVVLLYSLDEYIYVIIPVWISPFVFLWTYRWAVSKWTVSTVHKFLFVSLVVVILIGTLATRGSVPFLIFILLIMAASFWSFLIALRASVWLFKNHETKLTFPRGLGLTAWLGAYVLAWRYDIIKMYELYAALPPQPPPDCYIATAAARGHPQFVSSWTVKRAGGKSMQVNRQLQLLKCAELALLAIHPRMHKSLRGIYDVLGKWLAHRIQNPFVADMAYLFLKPWEWLAGSVLKTIVPEIDMISKKIYTNVPAK
jgi:hypothetical protein